MAIANSKGFGNKTIYKTISFHTKLKTTYIFVLIFIGLIALVSGFHSNIGTNELNDYNLALAKIGGKFSAPTSLTEATNQLNLIAPGLGGDATNSAARGTLFLQMFKDPSIQFGASNADGNIIKGIADYSILFKESKWTAVVIPLGFGSIAYAILYAIVSGSKNKHIFFWASTILIGLAITTIVMAVIDLTYFTDNVRNIKLIPRGNIAEYLESLEEWKNATN